MPPLDLRPRSASELVDAGFRLLRRHYWAFVMLGALGYAPNVVINLAQYSAASRGEAALFSLGAVGLALLIVPFYAVTQGALTIMASDAYQGEEARAGDALRRSLRRVLPATGVALLFFLAFSVGLVLLVVPGVYLFARLATAFTAVVVEGLGPIDAIRRAWARAEGRVGHSLATLALTLLLYFVVLFGATLVGGLAALLGSPLLVVAVTAVVAALVAPMVPIVTTLLYYDLRIRSEGYDLEVLSGQLDGAPLGAGVAAR